MNLFNNLSEETNKLIAEHAELIDQKLGGWIKTELKIQSGIAENVLRHFTIAKRRKNAKQVTLKMTSQRKKMIEALVHQGHDFHDFKTVTDYMIEKWWNDPQMSQHLTPDTIFRASNFPKYYEEALSNMIVPDTAHVPAEGGNQYEQFVNNG